MAISEWPTILRGGCEGIATQRIVLCHLTKGYPPLDPTVAVGSAQFTHVFFSQSHDLPVRIPNCIPNHVGVSKNRGGPPTWMVYNGKTPIKMDDLGGPPLFLETPM